MRKFLISISMIFYLLAIPTFSFANTTNSEDPIVIPIGGVFVSESDYNIETTQSETDIPIAKAPAGSYVTSKVISSYIEKNKFIGYNSATPDWSYAIKYTLYTGKTYKFSASITTKWGKASISGAYKHGGADIHFEANPKRASRLAIKSNVKVNKVQYKKWSNGKVIKTWTGIDTKPVGAKTNYVKYRK